MILFHAIMMMLVRDDDPEFFKNLVIRGYMMIYNCDRDWVNCDFKAYKRKRLKKAIYKFVEIFSILVAVCFFSLIIK